MPESSYSTSTTYGSPCKCERVKPEWYADEGAPIALCMERRCVEYRQG